MLILNDEHGQRAGVCSLDELCNYCSKAFGEYPLIMSDNAEQTVYTLGKESQIEESASQVGRSRVV